MFDWRTSREEPLGFSLRLERFETEQYPVRVKIGLRDAASGSRRGLVEIGLGERRTLPVSSYAVRLNGHDEENGFFLLEAGPPGHAEKIRLSSEKSGEVRQGDFLLSIVAWRADVKSVRVHVGFLENGKEIAGGWLSPNDRLEYRGRGFFLTAWGEDPFGNPFCGIQAVRDPGAPVFWTGCILFGLAVPLHLVLKGRRRESVLSARAPVPSS
jgi:hypothetical protein